MLEWDVRREGLEIGVSNDKCREEIARVAESRNGCEKERLGQRSCHIQVLSSLEARYGTVFIV